MDYKIELIRKQALGALYKLSKNKETFSASYADIARVAKLEKSLIAGCLRDLKANGSIEVESGGGKLTNSYRFLKEVPQDVIKLVEDLHKPSPVTNTVTNNEKKDVKRRKFKP